MLLKAAIYYKMTANNMQLLFCYFIRSLLNNFNKGKVNNDHQTKSEVKK